jgi:ankyrin repeat protein
MFPRSPGRVLVFILILTVGLGGIQALSNLVNRQRQNRIILHGAAKGDVGAVKRAVANGGDLNSEDDTGFTLLEWAAYAGAEKSVRTQLACRYALSDRTLAKGLTMAAWRGRVPIVTQFLDAGVAPDLRPDNSRTALISAARAEPPDRKGALAVARLLIARKADVNARDDQGNTPLTRAREVGFDEMARLLLAHGAHDEPTTRQDADRAGD